MFIHHHTLRWALILAMGAPLALTACPDDLVGSDADTSPTGPTPPTGPDRPPNIPPQESDELTLVEILPGRGLASGLEQVELIGTGFRAGMLVFFGESLAQDIFVLDNRRAVVLTPPRIPGLVDVRVVDADTGAAAVLEAGYLYFNPVQITEIDPPTGHILGGDPVVLRGTGFIPGSNVVFGRQRAVSVEIIDDSTVQVVTPAGVALGPTSVHVSNDLGVGTFVDGFLYVDAPRISGVVPAVGPVAGGTVIDIKGEGFHDPTTVVLGSGALIDVEVLDDTRVRGVAPAAAAAGSVDVLVSTTYGTTAIRGGYTYLDDVDPGDVVSILTVTPPAGPASGRNRVTVVAKGLTTAADTQVHFGGVPAQVITVDAAGHTAVVEAPGGDIGAVDVTLANRNGTDTAANAYVYEPFVRVYEVTPNFGPEAGGTAITIAGEGFQSGAQVRVGALPATAVTVIDDETMTAVTPPGSPGLANITVSQAGVTDTLVGGFAYQGGLDLMVLDPAQGSQAGGTLIALVGSGFPSDARVKVGGRNATHVRVVSPTLIEAKTPPGELGPVSVSVVSDSRGEVTLVDAFTYYDPESNYGGTWGEQVKGDVNVTVLDASNGAPIADAFVMLWTDPQTPYQGFTNIEGQITFSGDDLAGEQMASGSKEGYSSASVVEYDATNLTIFLNPTSPPSPGEPPSIEAPSYTGRVTNLTKAVPVPWGQCSQKYAAPAPLCDACETDSDCGGGYRCSDLPQQGKHCTLHCASSANCPTGFACYPLSGVEAHQCVPTAGEVTAFCDFSNPSIFDEDPLPAPGLEVNRDMTFTIPILWLGEVAVFCWAGIIDRSTNQFTPFALGVDRHVFVNAGDRVEGEILLAHPLNKTYTIRLDDVPRGPEGPDFNVLFRYLDLGSDGVIEFLDQVDSFGSQGFLVENFIGELTGDLYDASLTFMGGSFALSSNNLPYTMTLHQGIKSIEDDTMYYLEGDGTWTPERTGVTNNINALWANASGNLIGVGTDGLIIRSLGRSWATQPSGVDKPLNAVHGVGDSFAAAVGEDGAISHYDGFKWAKMLSPTSSDLRDVWVSAADRAYAVGYYTILSWDGLKWTAMFGNTSHNLNGVYGFAADDVWAVGNYGRVLRYDGQAWTTLPVGTSQNLRAVWGANPDDVWIIGEGGTILHWDGDEVTKVAVDTTQTLQDLWGDSADNITVIGARGTVLHWDGFTWDRAFLGGDSGSTSLLAIGGAPGEPVITGAHELILGPMLAVPERVTPANGGVMGADYRISWEHQPGVEPHFSYVSVAIPTLFGLQTEWTVVNDWDVSDVLLPDFPNIEGTPGISPGAKVLTIWRVYREGFDIDNYSNQDFNQFRWRSWSVNQVSFTKE